MSSKGKPRDSDGSSRASGPSLELVGREEELARIRACIRAGRNVLLEGPVGVGKTHLASAVTQELGRPVFRVDGDGRYSEQKLTGWFDPPAVLKQGYTRDAFVLGPLAMAMESGGVLFINELNRLPEGVQNVLLPAIDERRLELPRLGRMSAKEGFAVIATQNPKEFVATSHLSEAILDRFELVRIDYQSAEEERRIVEASVSAQARSEVKRDLVRLVSAAVALSRLTREHPRVRRGASVRAAQAIAQITSEFLRDGVDFENAFFAAALLALPTRIEIEREESGDGRSELDALIREWAESALSDAEGALKKKS